MNDFDLSVLVTPALIWFKNNKRDLPWRQDTDPYHVWLSEIMLQQTRVEAVKEYYRRFLTELPDLKALADCDEVRLLKLWEGLGYYNRARNLQKAARVIMETYSGNFPCTYEEIRNLPGIGDYTAGAISSICFGIKAPAVDGNVLRILARVRGDERDIAKEATKKQVRQELLPIMPEEAGTFNQALMEIGATVCLPNGAPHCGDCPWQDCCRAKKEGTIDLLPVKQKAKPRRIENKTVLILRDGDHILLGKRPEKGLLAGLYEFPNFEGSLSEKEILDRTEAMGLTPLRIEALPEALHIFSHIEWHMTGYRVRIADIQTAEKDLKLPENSFFVDLERAKSTYPIPSAFEKFVQYVNISL